MTNTLALQVRVAARYLAAVAAGALELAHAAARLLVRLETLTGLRARDALALAR